MTTAMARALFATFSPELRTAMKVAAQIEHWTPAQWVEETDLVADLLQMPDHNRACESALLGLYARITKDRK